MTSGTWFLALSAFLLGCGSEAATAPNSSSDDAEAADTGDSAAIEDSVIRDSFVDGAPDSQPDVDAAMDASPATAGECDSASASKKPSLLYSEIVGRTAHALFATSDRLLFVAAEWPGGSNHLQLMKTIPSSPVTLANMPRIDRAVIDGTAVVWFERREAIWESDLGGAFPRPYSPTRPFGIAVNGSYVFWTEEGLAVDNRDGRVKQARLGPGGGSGEDVAKGPASEAIAADADNIYIVTDYRPSLMPSEQTVVRIPRTPGGMPTDLVTRMDSTHQEIAVSAGAVVALLDGKTPEILAVSTAGVVTTLAKPAPGSSPKSLSARGGYAYWAEGKTIRRAAIDLRDPLVSCTV